MNPRKASVALLYNGKNATIQVAPYLASFRYTDVASGSSDSITLEINDRDRRWIGGWFPQKGDRLKPTVRMENWNIPGTLSAFSCGAFCVDDFSVKGNPIRMTLEGVAIPATSSFTATKRTITYRVTFKNEDGTLLDTQFVDRGGAAVDPITRPILPIAEPTKPPTEDQTFTFNTWNKLLSPILEDTEITATFAPHVRQYTVSFYAMNELLYSDTVDVYTGATYNGELPKRAETPGSYLYYLFTGWDKEFSNVTSDLRVNAVFAECAVPPRKVELQPGQKLTDVYTVNEIYAICRSELAKNYFDPLDEIEIPLARKAIVDTSIIMQVFGFNHFKKADGSGEMAHVVFGMKGTLAAGRRLNPSNTNVGGWPATEMRTWLNGTIIKELPQIWQSMIEEVIVRSSEGNLSPEIVQSNDKLFLFSHAELGWDMAAVPYRLEVDDDAETIKFPVFTDNNSRIKKTYNGEGSAVYWWLRSPEPSGAASFRYVGNGGGAHNNSATSADYVCFGFCVG